MTNSAPDRINPRSFLSPGPLETFSFTFIYLCFGTCRDVTVAFFYRDCFLLENFATKSHPCNSWVGYWLQRQTEILSGWGGGKLAKGGRFL